MKKKWNASKGLSGNMLLEGKGFAISYLGNADRGIMGGLFAGDKEEETAILVTVAGERKYFILNGDYRDAYEAVIDEGLEACLEIFRAHPEDKSSWSDGK